jgi:putative ABC transport system permease protein
MRQIRVSWAEFQDFLERNRSFDELGVMRAQSSVLTAGEVPERLETASVSPDIFQILGMKPAQGRGFAPEEGRPGNNHVAVLSAGLWQRRFGSDPGILGRPLTLDGASYTIVGVAPADFRLPASLSELWIPYAPEPSDLLPDHRGDRFLTMIGHLRSGVSIDQARSDLGIVAGQMAREHPNDNAGYGVNLVPLRDQLVGDIRPTLWMLMAAVAAVLLIACFNVAHLLLARAGAREKEIAVRTALGANPGRLLRQLLTESTVLALAAGCIGLLLAYLGTWILTKASPPGLAQAQQISVDWRVLVFTLGVAIITGLGFGLAPALSSARSNLNLVLRSGGRGGTADRTRSRVRDVLMVCEVASSAALLIGAGLLIRSFLLLQDVKPGFRTDHLLTMQLSLPPARYKGAETGRFYERLLARLAQLPGVQTTGISRFLPLGGSDVGLNFQIEGEPQLSDADQPRAMFRTASAGYFAALSIPLIHGRLFDSRDAAGTPKVVLINQAAARRFWPHTNPVGKRILSGLDDNQWSTIIGVVGDVKHSGLDAAPEPETYYHYLQIPPPVMNLAEGTVALVIRTSTDPSAMIPAVRGELRTLDPNLPAYNVAAMEDVVKTSVAQPRFRTFLISAFAGLALVLAALGLYGVVSYSVSQRTVEMGIRVALGAQRGGILKLVVFRAAGLALLGLAIGVGLALGISRIFSRFLFGISAADPITLVTAIVIILAVAVIASLIPALKAVKVDPITALRAE